jgi:hypothetical protein
VGYPEFFVGVDVVLLGCQGKLFVEFFHAISLFAPGGGAGVVSFVPLTATSVLLNTTESFVKFPALLAEIVVKLRSVVRIVTFPGVRGIILQIISGEDRMQSTHIATMLVESINVKKTVWRIVVKCILLAVKVSGQYLQCLTLNSRRVFEFQVLRRID